MNEKIVKKVYIKAIIILIFIFLVFSSIISTKEIESYSDVQEYNDKGVRTH